MATARLIPSTYQLSNTSYLSITNASNMYANTGSTNYATIQNKQSGTTSYYLYIGGFNFGSIPSDAIVSSFTVKLKAYQSGGSTSTSYRPYLCNNTSTISNSYSNVITTSAQTLTFSCTANWDTIKGYGNNFRIRVNCRRNNKNTAANFYIYGAEILVEYTVPIPYNISASGSGCTVTPSGSSTVYNGDSFTLKIEADRKPTVTDNGNDVSNMLIEKTGGLGYTVSTAPNASYGFDMNDNGYYESTNKGRASTTSLCVVNMNLPVECTVTFSLINYAESTYDYGILSNVDSTLTTSASADSSNVYWNGKNNNSANVQTVTYTVPSGEHYIYVKYFKDSYTDSNNDTLQFKVDITPNSSYTDTVYWEYTINDINENHVVVATLEELKSQLMLKINGAWTLVSSVYKKVNGTWVLQSDISNLFDTSVNYVKAN